MSTSVFTSEIALGYASTNSLGLVGFGFVQSVQIGSPLLYISCRAVIITGSDDTLIGLNSRQGSPVPL